MYSSKLSAPHARSFCGWSSRSKKKENHRFFLKLDKKSIDFEDSCEMFWSIWPKLTNRDKTLWSYILNLKPYSGIASRRIPGMCTERLGRQAQHFRTERVCSTGFSRQRHTRQRHTKVKSGCSPSGAPSSPTGTGRGWGSRAVLSSECAWTCAMHSSRSF